MIEEERCKSVRISSLQVVNQKSLSADHIIKYILYFSTSIGMQYTLGIHYPRKIVIGNGIFNLARQ